MTLVCLAVAAGCASRGGGVPPTTPRPADAATAPVTPDGRLPVPRLLGAYVVASGGLPMVEGLAVGSFSGLAYEPTRRQWAAASDEIRVPRLVWLDIGLGPTLHVAPAGMTRMTLSPTVPPDTLTALDMEGLTFFPDGSFAVSHEGHIDRDGVGRQPRVLIATAGGVITEVVAPRPRFTIDVTDRTHGVRHNLGFESLTRTPDGRLVVGLEQPLIEDGPASNGTRGGVVRLAEFGRDAAGRWTPGREWAYQLEPTPAVPGYDRVCEDGENGLSALLALTATTLLAVERACVYGSAEAPAYNPVRLFELSIDGAEDVSARRSLAGQALRLVRKRLVLDLETWRPQLPPLLSTLSNFEGVAFGPPGPNGERTVMLVSDDNFRRTQTTAFIWLALD